MNTPAPFPTPPLTAGPLDPFVTIEDLRDGPYLMPLAELAHTDAPATSHDIPSGVSWAFARRGRHLDPLVTVDGPDGAVLIPLAELTRTR